MEYNEMSGGTGKSLSRFKKNVDHLEFHQWIYKKDSFKLLSSLSLTKCSSSNDGQ